MQKKGTKSHTFGHKNLLLDFKVSIDEQGASKINMFLSFREKRGSTV